METKKFQGKRFTFRKMKVTTFPQKENRFTLAGQLLCMRRLYLDNSLITICRKRIGGPPILQDWLVYSSCNLQLHHTVSDMFIYQRLFASLPIFCIFCESSQLKTRTRTAGNRPRQQKNHNHVGLTAARYCNGRRPRCRLVSSWLTQIDVTRRWSIFHEAAHATEDADLTANRVADRLLPYGIGNVEPSARRNWTRTRRYMCSIYSFVIRTSRRFEKSFFSLARATWA